MTYKEKLAELGKTESDLGAKQKELVAILVKMEAQLNNLQSRLDSAKTDDEKEYFKKQIAQTKALYDKSNAKVCIAIAQWHNLKYVVPQIKKDKKALKEQGGTTTTGTTPDTTTGTTPDTTTGTTPDTTTKEKSGFGTLATFIGIGICVLFGINYMSKK